MTAQAPASLLADGATSPLFDRERAAALMEEAGLDALLGHSRLGFFHLSGFPTLDYVIDPAALDFVVVPRDPGTDGQLVISAGERLMLEDVDVWPAGRNFYGTFHIHRGPEPAPPALPTPAEALVQGMRRAGLTSGRIGCELDVLPQAARGIVATELPDVELVDAAELMIALRSIKTEEERRRLRRACELTEVAIEDALAETRPGDSERDVADRITQRMVAQGGRYVYVQVSTAPAAGVGGPSTRQINLGDVIRVDASASVGGYHSDLGRSFALGSACEEQRRYYATASASLETAIALVTPGRPMGEIFEAAMDVWHDAGYTDVRRHHVGHSIGLTPHERPMIAPGSRETAEPGMVLAVEVPCYVLGLGGFVPEDIIEVVPGGFDRYSYAPTELPVV